MNTVKNMIGGKQQQTMTVAAKKRLADLDDLDVPSADELDDEVEAKVVMVSKENEANVNQKNKIADLDDFDEPTSPLIPTPKKNSNNVKQTTTNVTNVLCPLFIIECLIHISGFRNIIKNSDIFV